MEALRQDDPRHFGPYTVLARLREAAGAVQYLARGASAPTSAPRTAVIVAARPRLAALPAFRRRFQAETGTAERLAGGWVQPTLTRTEERADGGELWAAWAYVPSLTLAEAIELTGPLPEHAVRVLGAGIAETLSRVHATGAVLRGLSPRTVALADDGPRLTAFGPLGGAVAAEARPGGQLSVRLGYLTPEQVEGEEPGPASDVFVLGLLLAYAATGTTPLADGPAAGAVERIAHMEPELGAVPPALRELVARCLAKDPASRPTAGEIAAELALEGAAALAKDGWLPARLTEELAEQAAHARRLASPAASLDASPGGHAPATGHGGGETAGPARVNGGALLSVQDRPTPQDRPIPQNPPTVQDRPTPHDPPTAQPTLAPGPFATPSAAFPQDRPAPPATTLPAPPPHAPYTPPAPVALAAPAPPPTAPGAVGRRTLLTGVAAGVAGLLVGGGGTLALGSDDADPPADARPSAGPRRRVVPGLPPEPRWARTLPVAEPLPLATALVEDRLLVLTGDTRATGIDLRTGRTLWRCADAAKGGQALSAGRDLCFVAGPAAFLWISTKDGRVEHRVGYADQFAGAPGLRVGPLAGRSGPVIWFTGSYPVPVAGKPTLTSYFFAYDIVRRKELWRAAVPNGRAPYTPGYELVAVRPTDLVVRQNAGTLTPADVKAAKGLASFRCFDRRTGKPLWQKPFGALAPTGAALGDEEGRLFGAVGAGLQAFLTSTGRPVWQLTGAAGSVFGRPVAAGPLLHTVNRAQEVGAVERATGRPVWHRSTEVAPSATVPVLGVSTTGATVLAADTAQVTAFAGADGRRLWKFQDAGALDPKGPDVVTPYRVLTAGTTAVVQRDRTFYALPVT
ncbi:PQQ-binding-like beta-propeller repeat protein [Streptomyces sp. DT24]|uniref:outer membrane protein assembly factor BamB family protein n=1 Tax=Streptomyces sp. DT24 TaxID=3416520 RepID=UPI003CEC2B45